MNELDYEKWKALRLKKNLSGEDALKAVKQDGHALQYVVEQTEEICLEAVKQDGFALRYVKEQTYQICLEAVNKSRFALRYVEERIFLGAAKALGLL